MNTLQIRHKQKFDYPISSICIYGLPDFEFKPDKKSIFSNFSKQSIRLIWLTYFSLILNGTILIKYKKIKKKILGVIPINRIIVFPQLDIDQQIDSKTGWIEAQIMASINNCQPSNEKDYSIIISDQAKMMINNMLGPYEEYIAPEKKIIERTIIYDKNSLWDYSYSSNPLEFKRKIRIDLKNNQEILSKTFEKIKQLELEIIESSNDLKKIRSKIIKMIGYELCRHEIKNQNEYSG